MWRPDRTRGRIPPCRGSQPCCGKRPAICYGKSGSDKAGHGPESVDVDAVCRPNLEPVVVQITHCQAVADLHKRVLNPHFELVVLRHLSLIAARAALIGHLSIATLLVVAAFLAEFVPIG